MTAAEPKTKQEVLQALGSNMILPETHGQALVDLGFAAAKKINELKTVLQEIADVFVPMDKEEANILAKAYAVLAEYGDNNGSG